MSDIRALIVDDSSVMRKIVERSLRQAGLESLIVCEAASGIDGLEILKSRSVDLILSDQHAVDGWAGVRASVEGAGTGAGDAGDDDHHRIERGACEASD